MAAVRRRLSEEVRKNSAPSGGRQPKEEGKRRAAEELGVDEKTVRNAVQIVSMTDEAKEAAREVGIDDNRSKLKLYRRDADAVEVTLPWSLR